MNYPVGFSIVLLYDKIASSLPIAQALKEKDLEVHIAQNAGELIQMIANNHMDLVGLSVNHASTNSLIQVLREKTTVKVLVFGEDKYPSTLSRIEKIEADYKIQGIATGYNVWMKIVTLVREKTKETEAQNASGSKRVFSRKNKNETDAIIIKSKEKEEVEKQESRAFSFIKKKDPKKKSKSSITNYEQNDDDLGDVKQASTQEEKTGKVSEGSGLGTKSKKKSSDLMFFKKGETEKKKSGLLKPAKKPTVDELDGEVAALETMFKDPFKKKTGRQILNNQQEKTPSDGEVDVRAENAGEGKVIMTEDIQDGEPLENEIDLLAESEKISDNAIKSESPEEHGNVISMGGYRKKKENQDKAKTKKRNTNLKEIVQSAGLTEFKPKEAELEKFISVSKFTVIPIDHDEERGFLLCCTHDNQFLTSGQAIDGFKNKLTAMLQEAQIDEIGENYNIELFDVNVEKMVRNKANFHFMFEDSKNNNNVLMCYIPSEIVYPDTNKALQMKMFKVSVDVIPEHTPLSFSVFLYFSRNKKLIPYLRRGGKLTTEQMKRLQKRGMNTVYIFESERKALYSFFITQLLYQDQGPIKKQA